VVMGWRCTSRCRAERETERVNERLRESARECERVRESARESRECERVRAREKLYMGWMDAMDGCDGWTVEKQNDVLFQSLCCDMSLIVVESVFNQRTLQP
jgi:hypothetical protein